MTYQTEQSNEWWQKHQAYRAIKKPRRQRHLDLLARAASVLPGSVTERGILLHREGGMAYKGDVEELVQAGLLTIKRVPYSRGWGGDYWLRYTMAFITDKGRQVLKTGRFK